MRVGSAYDYAECVLMLYRSHGLARTDFNSLSYEFPFPQFIVVILAIVIDETIDQVVIDRGGFVVDHDRDDDIVLIRFDLVHLLCLWIVRPAV